MCENYEKAYVVVRADLSAGQQIVQTAHAVAKHEKEWLGSMSGRTMVVLQVPNQLLLTLLYEYITDKFQMEATMFWEPDIGQNTAFAVSPSEYCGVFAGLKLAGS